MIRNETDIRTEQRSKAAALHPGDDRGFPFPEPAVMHQQHVRMPGNRLIDKRLRSAHAEHDASDLLCSFDLQSVRSIVAEVLNFQILIEIGNDFVSHKNLLNIQNS